MNKIRILIIEDDPTQADEIAQIIRNAGYEVTGIAEQLTDALGLFYAQSPDLAVVDIYLDGQPDGITFAKKLNENPNTSKPVIFLTQHADLETFRKAKGTFPYNYLLKPFNPPELQYAIELALEKFHGSPGSFSAGDRSALLKDKSLFVKTGHSIIKISIGDIYYVEVDGKYSKIISEQGNFLVQIALKNLEDKLSPYQFIRVHRNYLVNIALVRKVHLADHLVILSNNETVPFSQTYKDRLTGRFEILK